MQAAEASPVLAQLAELVRDSQARLRAVESLLPASLLATIKAGPIEGDTWCLLVDGTAAAAKLRQLLPTLMASLTSKGWKINSIRVKVQTRSRPPR